MRHLPQCAGAATGLPLMEVPECNAWRRPGRCGGGGPPLELEPGSKEKRVQRSKVRESTIAASVAVAQPAGGMVRREGFLSRMAQPPAFDPAVFCRGESGLVRDRVPGARFRRLRGAAAEAAARTGNGKYFT